MLNLKKSILFILVLQLLSNCTSKAKHDDLSSTSKNSVEVQKDSLVNYTGAKINFQAVDSIFIQKNFKYKGNLKQFVKWDDKEGTHIVFTSETGVYHTDENEEEGFKQNAEIFCFHYLKKENSFSRIWKIYDFSTQCPVDAMAKFTDKSIEVTDLNQNGIPEIWTMYRTACRGDVSPSTLKLIMYEGDKKYKLEGTSKIDLGEEYRYGGEIEKIINFNDEPSFLEFAKKKWNLNAIETFG